MCAIKINEIYWLIKFEDSTKYDKNIYFDTETPKRQGSMGRVIFDEMFRMIKFLSLKQYLK